MATILFPPPEPKKAPTPRKYYNVILTDVIRGASDAIDALSLFRTLLLGTDTSDDTPGFMAFDAHGGDTGCQLRAGMLKEVFETHREMMLDAKSDQLRNPDWIDTYLERLESIRAIAKEKCAKLTQDKIMPNKLGLSDKQQSIESLLSALGWNEYITQPLYGEPVVPLPRRLSVASFRSEGSENTAFEPEQSPAQLPSKQSRHMKRAMLHYLTKILPCIPTVPRWKERAQSLGQETLNDSTDISEVDVGNEKTLDKLHSSSTSVSASSDEEPNSLLQTTWDLSDASVLVRFITYSYTLSKYKQFCRHGDVVGARVCPDVAMNASIKMAEPFTQPENHHYKPPKSPRYRTEFSTLQAWLSDFSCAWLSALASRSPTEPKIGSLVNKTMQKSAKGLTAVACYPGYLLLREAWARTQQTMILVDRHYCPSGYHMKLYYAKLTPPEDTVAEHPCARGQRVRWRIRPVTVEELRTAPSQDLPHLIVMGNSIDGSHDDYIQRVPQTDEAPPELSHPHHDAACPSSVAHDESFINSDHDRLALGFFAAHKFYAFPLASKTPEHEFVEQCLDEFDETHPPSDGAITLKEGLQQSREDADELGSGHHNLRVFGIQHIALETKARIAKIVERAESEGYLLPLGADVPIVGREDDAEKQEASAGQE